MNYNKIGYWILLLSLFMVSCSKDFLDRRPLDNLTDANFYQNEAQLLQSTAPLYNAVWLSYNFKAIQSVELRANTLFWNQESYKSFSVSSADGDLSEAWQSFFNVVGQANMVMSNVQTYTPESVSEAAKRNAIAEARLMRGLAYSMLVQLWGPVPVLENNLTLLTDTTQRRNTIESVWEFVLKDMVYAKDNLFTVSPQSGRLNKYAAEAMLSRMYLTRAGVGMPGDGSRRQADLDSAAYYARNVIANGPFKMLDEYEELFKMKNNNNEETILSLQWVYDGGWGTQNATQAFLAFNSHITGVGDGWGGQIGAGYNTLMLYEDFVKDKRRRATYMFPGDVYDYISHEVGGTIRPYLRVPFNAEDQYSVEGNRSQFAWVKKYIVGRPEDNEGKVMFMATEINTYMMRLPEMYLTLAEALLGSAASTANAEAVNAVNIVRARAGLDPLTQVAWHDIYRERMLEFAVENMSTFDYSRLHYYDPQKAYKMLSEMNRGYYWVRPIPNIDNPVNWEVTERELEDQRDFVTVNSANFYLPIPDAEIVRAPNLLNPPIPFESNN